MRKKLLLYLFLIIGFTLTVPWGVKAATKPIDIYFFYGNGCPHCAQEQELLNYLEQNKYKGDIKIHQFEVWYNIKNANLLTDMAHVYNIRSGAVPLTFIGDNSFSGFGKGYTDVKIENAINNCLNGGDCIDPFLKTYPEKVEKNQTTDQNTEAKLELDYPIVRNINLDALSLPVLTIVLAAVDGFNPCAMWVLLFLISLLLGMENKKRMWLIGIIFIMASAATYFLFLTAWLNLFLFIGYTVLIRIAIGILAIIAGIIHLKDYFTLQEGVCKVTNQEKRKRIFDRLKELLKSKYLLYTIVGVIILAFAVNLIELVCSIGLPAMFTGILSFNNLPGWQYYSYLLLYILIFMLDDIVIFVIAMLTLRATGLTGKYTKYSNLIGGILILIIGILLILKPELLMFG